MKRKLIAIVLFSFLASSLTARADGSAEEKMKALQKRFADRYAQLADLKSAGTIGETFAGFVDWVKDADSASAKLVEDENTDRQTLYQIIAEKEKTTAKLVGERNARRNLDKAKPGEYFKGKDGKWTQKP